MRRIACLAASLVGAGCLVVNPGFDEVSEGSVTGTTSATSTGTATGTAPGTGPATETDSGPGTASSTTQTSAPTTTDTGVGATLDTTAGSTTGPGETTGTTATTGVTGPDTEAQTLTDTSSGGTGAIVNPECAEDPSIIACYDLEDAAQGELLDGSMYQNSGLAVSVTNVVGVDGNAAEMTVNSGLKAADSPSLNPEILSVALWIRPSKYPVGEAGLVSKPDQFRVHLSANGKFGCSFAGLGGLLGGSVPLNEWTHIVCMFDGNSLSMYEDGESRGMIDVGGSMAPGDGELALGNDAPSFQTPFEGALDRVWLWDQPLTELEICELAAPNCNP